MNPATSLGFVSRELVARLSPSPNSRACTLSRTIQKERIKLK